MVDNIIYLSYPLELSTPAYGGETGLVEIRQIRSIERGDTSNNSAFAFPGHIGTHIDFPFHFSNEGRKCDDYPAPFWVFNEVGFLECSIEMVEENLDQLPGNIEILIVKTGFGSKRNEREYWAEQPIIPSKLARLFKNKFPKLRVFGFDMISMTSKLDRSEGKQAHIAFLLENDILVLEDMNLDGIQHSPKRITISPLIICGADGTPCTILAEI